MKPGSTTSASQQASILLRSNDPIKTPRAAFRRDLQKHIQQSQSAGHDIILTGDFNETLGQDFDGLTKVISACNLVDVMSAQHPETLPVTYSRGGRCLDYIFVSSRIVPAVARCGYEAFGNRFASDHRDLFVDFNTSALFGTNIPKLSPRHEPRLLNSTNLRQVTEYVRKAYDLCEASNVFDRATRLSNPGDRHQFAERLDRDVTKICLSAEKRLTKFQSPAWSLALVQARQKVQILKECVSLLKNNRQPPPSLVQDQMNHPDMPIMPTALRAATKQLREAQLQVQQIVDHRFENREDERLRKIETLSKSLDPSHRRQAGVLQQLRAKEVKARMFAKLKALVRTRGTRNGVTHLEIPVHPDANPKTCTEWRLVDIPNEVLSQLQRHNQLHFGKAHGTPFTVPPLSSDFGFTGVTPSSDDVLKGMYVLDDEISNKDESLRLFFTNTYNRPTRLQHSTIDLQYPRKISKPSSKFGGNRQARRHLGSHQYSAVREDDSEELRTLAAELNYKQQALLRVHLQLIDYSLERGYSFKRWQTVANTSMLFKEKGNIKADYNLAMGLKWRYTMYAAEALNVLNQGQFGSRPRSTALDPVFIKELQFELSRVTRKTLVQTNYDADSCYDLIIPNVAMLVSQKYGVPASVAKLLATSHSSQSGVQDPNRLRTSGRGLQPQ